MQTNNHDSRPPNRPDIALSWAVDDRDAPTELTIYDPQSERTTHWLTIDRDFAYDLAETV
ncbi:hypothetical protein NDI54_13880 [Haloarcula sp. S1AR25-5A]|uniref:DUF7511 domain-containing protein n=1 Tax=Haloarcula terrestris TaxID=2950533 RepID=A0AAE4EYV4_9EURY|nr:hypothetical protein [Haloarcula terrestris]MDS0222432.1 hypothetical protein [Haloarcula terrestris]